MSGSGDGPIRFELELVAGPGDIDELGHVSNITYVSWLQLAATEHSSAVGWDHAAYRALGSVFVVKRHEIDYRVPAYDGQPAPHRDRARLRRCDPRQRRHALGPGRPRQREAAAHSGRAAPRFQP
jgi:hypothetical protein